jgi:dihydrodipicolinate synthase/N-acetylneuraminate lyase
MLKSRRELLKVIGVTTLAAQLPRVRVSAAGTGAPKAMRGAFIILNTPFTATGEVDWDDLEREVAFVDRAGCQGIVWPQGSSGVTTLTRDERQHGMEVLATAVKGRGVTLVLGVQGRDTRRRCSTTPDAPMRSAPTR